MKGAFKIIYDYFRYSVKVFKQLKRGQKTKFDLLQLSHRLEKGLTMSDPKPLWGWDKARKIANLIKVNDDAFSNDTAAAVLSAYLDAKSHSNNIEDVKFAQSFTETTGFHPIDYTNKGGAQMVHVESFSEDDISVIERLFNSRHSVRDFE